MKRVLLAGLALAFVFGINSANAADLAPTSAYKSPPLASPQINWTGWYAGIGAGYEAGTVTGSAVTGFDIEPRVWYFGLEGGYRIELPSNIVLGLDIGMPIWASSNTFTPPGAGGSLKMDPEFIFTSEAQVGYAIDRWLPYAGFGVGFADTKATALPVGAATVSDTQLIPLYLLTFGVSYAWTNQVIVGLRYDHIELDQHNFTFATTPVPTVAQAGANSDGVSAYIQYKF